MGPLQSATATRGAAVRRSVKAHDPAALEEISKSGILSGLPKRRRVPSGTAMPVAGVVTQPVVLHPPTGRLTEVRGRVELLELLVGLVADPDGRFHVLAGMGGVGKTTVALALLARVCGGDQDTAGVSAGLEALLSVGLIEPRFGSGQVPGIVKHPLVAAASRLHLSAETTAAAARLLQSAVASLRPESDWPVWFNILPHLRSVLGLAPAAFDDQALALLAKSAARVCYALAWSGAHATAAELAEISLGHADRLGAQHEAILSLRAR